MKGLKLTDWMERVVGCLPHAMEEFRAFQSGIKTITDVEVKDGDHSLFTVVDKLMQDMVLQRLASMFPEVAAFAEEGGENAGSGEYYMYFDPVDGTRELTTQTALSVMIVGLMDRANEGLVSPHDTLVGAVIAEPSTGRIWAATEGGGCHKFAVDRYGNAMPLGPCDVWEGPISRQTSVFFDSSQGGTNVRDPAHPYQLLTDAQNAELYALLNPQTHVRVLGPNGQIEALVANGARGVGGSMSLHLGWPWDACGVLLVLEAGGAARAFSIVNDGLVDCNPLEVNSYDFLICANNKANADHLADELINAYVLA
jgi:fructose-1,6-bisphosphatase/inositol monophosphatase family enzyme